MPQQPPPAKKRPNFLPLIALVVVVGVIAGAYFLYRDHLTADVVALEVGDCIDLPSTDDQSATSRSSRARQPHDAEVFLNMTDPAANGAAVPRL